jgi:hypothetical protein
MNASMNREASRGRPIHPKLVRVLRRSARWDQDPESARAALSAAVSLLLRLQGRDPDPARSREHVLLSVLAARRLARGRAPSCPRGCVTWPSRSSNRSVPSRSTRSCTRSKHKRLAAALKDNCWLSPTFASWHQGATLDVGDWLTPKEGKTPAVVVSVAHLNDDERALLLGVLLEDALFWVRALPGSQRLRALVVFDEVYGFLPPHPQSPPTKRPLVALMKQARAFGVSVLPALPQSGHARMLR